MGTPRKVRKGITENCFQVGELYKVFKVYVPGIIHAYNPFCFAHSDFYTRSTGSLWLVAGPPG